MNRFLSQQFAAHESLLHIESRNLFESEDTLKQADNYKLLCHVPLPRMIDKLDVLRSRTTIATFRLPIRHVLSHLSCV